MPSIRLVSVPNIEYFHNKNKIENKTAKQNILVTVKFCLPVFSIKGKGQNISLQFVWLCTSFSTTTQMQGLNARLTLHLSSCNKQSTCL